MDDLIDHIGRLDLPLRLLVFACVAVGTHMLVRSAQWLGSRLTANRHDRSYRKLRSVVSLVTSTAVFSLYFIAIGFILRELGVSLTAYLASASVIGLAVGFGSQGVVQDVVAGLTFIFSDLMDVGDLVELSGETGIVQSMGMRFIELENALGARVFVPNRTVSNVINYPRGYVRCIADVTLRGDARAKEQAIATATSLARAVHQQFPGILVTEPSIEGRRATEGGKEFLRIKFRVWPDRGDPIEETFRKELTFAFKVQDPDYADWMTAVYYEVEARSAPVRREFKWIPGRRG